MQLLDFLTQRVFTKYYLVKTNLLIVDHRVEKGRSAGTNLELVSQYYSVLLTHQTQSESFRLKLPILIPPKPDNHFNNHLVFLSRCFFFLGKSDFSFEKPPRLKD